MCNIILQSFMCILHKDISFKLFSYLNTLMSFSRTFRTSWDTWFDARLIAYKNKMTFERILYWHTKKDNFFYIKCFEMSLIDFNEAFIPYNGFQFLDWPSIVAHSSTGLMYITYALVILVYRNIPALL